MRIKNGRIAEVGSWPDLARAHPDLPVIGGDHQAVIPGLINAHHHSNGVTAQQHGRADQLLELWLLSLAQSRPATTYLSTLLSSARLLCSGVTAVVDVHKGRGTAAQFRDGILQGLRAYDEAGMRVAFAAGISERSFLVWGEDESFLAGLPAAVRAQAARRMPAADAVTIDEYFAIMAELQADHQAHNRLDLWFGPPGPQWVTDATLGRMVAMAEERGMGIQTHLLESLYEKYHGSREYGTSTVTHLHQLGLLSPRFSFAHGVWLSSSDLEILAETGAQVSHNPSSNLRLRAGVAPLNGMLEGGVNVALGMDGTTLNDDEDMFTELRLAHKLHRTPELDGPAPTVQQIWRLATEGGANLLLKNGHLGQLKPGFAADVVLLNLERMLWPWSAPEAEPVGLLLARAQARDVDTVLVAGERVVAAGKPTRIDVQAAGEELARMLTAAPLSAEAAAMVQALTPHVAAHYRNWPGADLIPYEVRNSRQ